MDRLSWIGSRGRALRSLRELRSSSVETLLADLWLHFTALAARSFVSWNSSQCLARTSQF